MPLPVEFTVPVKPVPKGRPRFSTHGGAVRTFTPKRTLDAERVIALAARRANNYAVPTSRPVSVSLVFGFAYPKSWSRKRTEEARRTTLRPQAHGDTDNLTKTALDAVNGILWVDDRQVVRIEAEKVYGETDFVRMKVEEV